MNHAEIENILAAYLDKEVSVDEQKEVEQHFSGCNECRNRLRDMRAVSSLIQEAGGYELSVGFHHRVMSALRDEKEDAVAWMPVEALARRFVLGLSVVVLLFLTISVAMPPEQPLIMESYLSGESSDSLDNRTLLTKDALSKEDILFAVVTR